MHAQSDAGGDDHPDQATIRRLSLHDQVVTRLRAMILAGELAAGERVAEKRLCDSLGISRTPLREALKVLAAERLVILRPNRGAVVSPVSRRSVAELFPLCATLERLAAETACRQGLDAADEILTEIMGRWRQATAGRVDGALPHLTEAFRRRLFEISANSILRATYEAVGRQVLRACLVAGPLPADRQDLALATHERMMDCLSRGDCDAFARLVYDYRLWVADFVRDNVADVPEIPD